MKNELLQQAKDNVVKKYGYESFEQFDDKSTFGYDHNTPKIIDEIALDYHKNQIENTQKYIINPLDFEQTK